MRIYHFVRKYIVKKLSDKPDSRGFPAEFQRVRENSLKGANIPLGVVIYGPSRMKKQEYTNIPSLGHVMIRSSMRSIENDYFLSS